MNDSFEPTQQQKQQYQQQPQPQQHLSSDKEIKKSML